MLTNTKYYYPVQTHILNTQKPKPKVGFGKIESEHLFIDMPDFGKDRLWGKSMANVAEIAGKKIKAKAPFDEVLDYIADEYRNYRVINTHKFNRYVKKGDLSYFGLKRSKEIDGNPWPTLICKYSRYEPYIEKFEQIVDKKIKESKALKCNKDNRKSYVVKEKDLYLCRITISGNKGCEDIVAYQAPVKNVDPALKHIEGIYNDLQTGNKNLDKIHKQVGEIHWFFSQTAPYYKGTAGIGDILTKAIYESLDIQVSPWKKGLAPDLEALTMDLDDYKENYSTFFKSPPVWMYKSPTITG